MKTRKRMRHDRVCSCMADGTVSYLSSRELRRLVNSEMAAVVSTQDARRRYMHGLRAAQLCEESRHEVWAWKMLSRVQREVSLANSWWADVELNPRFYSFDGVVAHAEMLDLGSRLDRLVKRLGHPERADYRRRAVADYRMLWLEKYGEPYWTEDWWDGDD